MKIAAPGKLILSGEHSVVYGHPALAMAVNRYVITSVDCNDSNKITFHLSDLGGDYSQTADEAQELTNRIQQKYLQFLKKECHIRDVLKNPHELAQFALGLYFNKQKIVLKNGLKIKVQSTVPIGCGMGSSAATIVSLMHAAGYYTHIHLSLKDCFSLALQAENAQHGQSSGFDLRISLMGGSAYLRNKKMYPRPLPKIPLQFVNTGFPSTTTGECVAAAAPHFLNSQRGDDFAAVTNAMDLALQKNPNDLNKVIRENHRLLISIGVVPEKVQEFIFNIEKKGGAAKICGAGAVMGEKAGILLVLLDDESFLKTLCERVSYPILSIKGESRGIHVI